MKLNGYGAALSLMATSTLMLSACGSDNNASSGESTSGGGSSSANVDCAGKKSLKASGSTAQANAMTRFVNAYEQACSGYTLNYTSNGSGAGVSEFVGNQTDLGGSDSPLSQEKGEYDKAAQRCGSPAWNLPVVFGPIAITYNVDGVDGLVLDGPTAAKIFNGTVTSWDDPAVKALNPNASLPAQPITVVYRSDESGTTDNFQKYLDAASDGAWGKGAGKAFNGGVGEGAKGNEGTSAAIKNTPGSITYNEWSFAQAQGPVHRRGGDLRWPRAGRNQHRNSWKDNLWRKNQGRGQRPGPGYLSFYKPTETGAYPIVLATYEIVCSKYPEADTGQAVKAFLQSTISPGQEGLADNGYIPFPADISSPS